MIERRYGFKGLDLRTKDILKDPLSAFDLQNVELDSQRNLIKRFGYESVDTLANCIQLIPYQEGNTLIAICTGATAIYKLVSGSWEAVNWMGSGSAFQYTEPLSYVEYGGVIYMADPSGINPLIKFDGYRWYRAGAPKPAVTFAGSASSTFYRYFNVIRDCQGNVVFSDYTQINNGSGGRTYDRQATVEGGFYYRYAIRTSAFLSDVIDESNPTIDSLSDHNYVAGDWVPVLAQSQSAFPAESIYVNLKVESVTASTITFDVSTLPSGYFVIYEYTSTTPAYPQYSFDRTEEIWGAESSNSDFGYELFPDLENNGFVKTTEGLEAFASTSGAFESVYDSTFIKGLPPNCRYATIYNNVLVLANEFYIQEEIATISEAVRSGSLLSLRDSIYWSDLSVGGSVESFPPFNFEIIGKTEEGGITGLFASSDELVVFKQRQVYSLTGLLSLGNYRIRSTLSNGIGCLSHQSIIETSGACLFQGQRGIYLAGNGGPPMEVSDIIEPLFTSGIYDLTKTKIVNDVQKEKFYIYLYNSSTPANSIILVYDYYFKEWFKYTGIDAVGGLAVLGESVYHSDGSETFVRNATFSDAGVAIEAFYKTAYQDLGIPSLKKKFTGLEVLNISNVAYTLSIAEHADWKAATVQTISPISFPTTNDTKSQDRRLRSQQCLSMALTFSNNVLDEGMHITGYELEVETTQRRAKGDE